MATNITMEYITLITTSTIIIMDISRAHTHTQPKTLVVVVVVIPALEGAINQRKAQMNLSKLISQFLRKQHQRMQMPQKKKKVQEMPMMPQHVTFVAVDVDAEVDAEVDVEVDVDVELRIILDHIKQLTTHTTCTTNTSTPTQFITNTISTINMFMHIIPNIIILMIIR